MQVLDARMIDEAALYLELKKPYEIRIKSKSHNWAAGFCEQHTRKGKILKHVITLYLPNIINSDFTLESVILHELVHAWQAENGLLIEGDYHGADFQSKAYDLGEALEVADIFHPATDVD